MKKQLGISLSELLIGLFLASLLSTILIQTYLLNKGHYHAIHQSLTLNFEVQWAQDLLADSIRRAGFTPCLNLDQLQLVDRRANKKNPSSQNIEIKTEEVHIKRMSEYFGELRSVFSKQDILVSSDASLRVGQSLLIADCERAEVHQIIQVKKSSQGFLLTLDSPLFFTYPSLTYVGQWLEEHWFIKKNQEGINALYYQQIHSEELTPFIHSMKVQSNKGAGKNKIDVVWGLDDKKEHSFSVWVRT